MLKFGKISVVLCFAGFLAFAGSLSAQEEPPGPGGAGSEPEISDEPPIELPEPKGLVRPDDENDEAIPDEEAKPADKRHLKREKRREHRQDSRKDNRKDRQVKRANHREDRQDHRKEKQAKRQENRQEKRTDRKENRKENREDRQKNRN